ncbi:MAG: hypothetical protein IPM20_00250 [Gammaproteobacteria bacterium]|nr:hypothetical protein [Gammaproteobacteria bacterium]
MRYKIDAWLDGGDPHLKITETDSGTVRLQWIYHREVESAQSCLDGPPCAGCCALHSLINHLFLLACADGVCAARHADAGSNSPKEVLPRAPRP